MNINYKNSLFLTANQFEESEKLPQHIQLQFHNEKYKETAMNLPRPKEEVKMISQ